MRNQSSARRLSILQRHRELIGHAYIQMKKQGMDRPVIFVLDLDDQMGHQCAVNVLINEGNDEGRAQKLVKDMKMQIMAKEDHPGELIPTYVIALPYIQACTIAHMMTANGNHTIQAMPPHAMVVVIVSDNGNSYIGLPLPKAD